MAGIEEYGSPLAANVRTLAAAAPLTTAVADINAILAAMRAAGLMSNSSVYDAAMLAMSGLKGYWPVGEASGTAITDRLGVSPGTLTVGAGSLGATPLLVGDAGTSLSCGGDTRVRVPYTANLALIDTYSLLAWFNITPNGVEQSIIGRGQNAGCLEIGPDNRLRSVKENAAVLCDSGGAISAAVHFAVATKAAAANYLYLDGADVTANVSNETCIDSGYPLWIGVHDPANNGNLQKYVTGLVAREAIFNRAITPTEVANLWKIGAGL
jgi:hypothetical protein